MRTSLVVLGGVCLAALVLLIGLGEIYNTSGLYSPGTLVTQPTYLDAFVVGAVVSAGVVVLGVITGDPDEEL